MDATTEESDCTATTSLGMEQIDILDLEVAESNKKTNYVGQSDSLLLSNIANAHTCTYTYG